MKCCCCNFWTYNFNIEERQQASRSKMIDKNLEREKRQKRREVRILLLGAGESGKSTFLKQMRIIHNLGFDHESVQEFQHVIYSNAVMGMRVLLDAHEKLQIPWEKESNKVYSDLLMHHGSGFIDQYTFTKLALAIERCWDDASVRYVFDNRNLFQISDSVKFFFDDIGRISSKDWLPTVEDILFARRATKGIYELAITINNVPFKFIDVGGQRSQRSKWLQCFDSITSVLFLVATSEYDQVLLEDRQTNRLHESRTIFDTLINNVIFSSVSFILFLNKFDLLAEKVNSGSRLSNYFPTFKGSDHSVEEVKTYILNSFIEVRRSRYSELYYHFTTAVDTENIRHVFNAVKGTILKKNLEGLMLE